MSTKFYKALRTKKDCKDLVDHVIEHATPGQDLEVLALIIGHSYWAQKRAKRSEEISGNGYTLALDVIHKARGKHG